MACDLPESMIVLLSSADCSKQPCEKPILRKRVGCSDAVGLVGGIGAGGGRIVSAAAEILDQARVARVIDAGHVPTERPGMRSLYAAVAALGVETRDLTGLKTNPWGR